MLAPQNLPAISHELATYFSLEITPEYSCAVIEKKGQNLMMSVLCSNSLIFAPEMLEMHSKRHRF